MNPLKERLSYGEFVTAAWLQTGSSDVAEALVHAGWNTILIDGEHGIGDLETWVAISRAVEAAGGQVVLRVPTAEGWFLNKVLDRGIRSILVPRVNTPEAARAIAEACYYPPRGSRGYAAGVVRASGFGARPDYALEEAHNEVLLMVQCEHVDAAEKISELAEIPGVDVIFIGPNDLAGSVNRLERLADEKVQVLIEKVEAECSAKGKMIGTVPSPGRGYAELKEKGYGFVASPADIALLAAGARAAAFERDTELGIKTAQANTGHGY